MPAIGSLSINDGQATPVAHVFAPVSTDGTKARLANRVAGLPVGYEKLELELREPKSAAGAYRLIGKMTRPIMQVVDGVNVVVRTSTTNFDVNFAQNSTAAERKDDVALIKNLFGHATVISMVDTLEPLY